MGAGPIAGIIIGLFLGLTIFVVVCVCVVCAVMNKKRITRVPLRRVPITRVPRTITVNQPQATPASATELVTNSHTATQPTVFTAQPPPSYATSSQYKSADTAKILKQLPPSYEDHCKQNKEPNQQTFDPSYPPCPVPYPQAASPPPVANPCSTLPTPNPNPYPNHGAATLPH